MTTVKDDRTLDQRITHRYAVCARDNFMSGWGAARNGYSRCCWATDDINKLPDIERMLRGRKEMKYINTINLETYRAPRNTAHFHIYVWDR